MIIIKKDDTRVQTPSETSQVSIPSLKAAKNPKKTYPKFIQIKDIAASPSHSQELVPAIIFLIP